jgi:hypothetical protein
MRLEVREAVEGCFILKHGRVLLENEFHMP